VALGALPFCDGLGCFERARADARRIVARGALIATASDDDAL
jgi:hypothetical protein